MKPIYKAWLIQIEITNACHLSCAHCTRAVSHVKKPYFADLAFVEKALLSLQGWTRGVGCIGGEPTLHPDFPAICKLFRKYFPKRQCGLFTAGGKRYEEHKELIDETFGIINFNDHEMGGVHQPMMIASKDVIKDDKLRDELIDKCWLQTVWSPSITPKGAFFCEVAATFDMLFNGPGGYPIEPGWWKRTVPEFRDQRDRYCTCLQHSNPDGEGFDRRSVQVCLDQQLQEAGRGGLTSCQKWQAARDQRRLYRGRYRANTEATGSQQPAVRSHGARQAAPVAQDHVETPTLARIARRAEGRPAYQLSERHPQPDDPPRRMVFKGLR